MMAGLQGCTSKQYKPGGDEASGFIHCPDDLDGLGVRPARERCIWLRTSASLSSANDSRALKATSVRLDETLASFVAAMIRTPGSSSLSACTSALNPASEFGLSPKAAQCLEAGHGGQLGVLPPHHVHVPGDRVDIIAEEQKPLQAGGQDCVPGSAVAAHGWRMSRRRCLESGSAGTAFRPPAGRIASAIGRAAAGVSAT